MKKIFFSLLAIAALASCAKTEAVYTEDNSEIKIAPVTSLATKTVYGAIDGTSYPTAEEFVVNAYWNGTTHYLTDVVFANKGQYWGGQDATYYWPKNGSLEFACYSPEDVEIEYTYPNAWAGTYTQTENTAETIDLLIAPLTVPYTAQTATENVSVVFEHALSWITIKVKAANPEAAAAYTLHDIIVDQAFTTGTLAADMADGFKYNDWAEEKTNPADYYVVKGGNLALTTTAEVVEDAVAGTVVLPQVPTTLTINFTQNEMEGTPALGAQTVTVPLELDNEEDNIWHPGKHYIYTVTFDVDEILINPSVVDWEDVVVEDKPFDGAGQIATVANETELLAALEAEVAEIELTAEVELTAALELDYNVAITGGGFAGKPINVTGGVVSFENVAFANGTAGTESAVYVKNGNTNVTFQNCTFDEYAYEAIQYVSEDGLWVCVDGCTFNAAAHRDLHLQVKNASKAEVKITNNTFNGVDADSYVTVYGFDMERMILANNVTETPANYVNVWISDLFDDTKLTIEGFAAEGTFVTTIEELQAALDAATEDVEIALGADLAGNVTVTQNKGVNVTIEGYEFKFDGTITINGQSKLTTGEALVIKNVNFATESTAAKDFISSSTDAVRYAENVTIEGCTFTAPEGSDVVGMRLRQAYNIVVKNCTMNGGHSLAQNTSCSYQKYEKCTLAAGRGINVLTSGDVDVINCDITATKADGYGVRVDAAAGNVMNVDGCAIEAYEPIVLRSAKATYTLNLSNTTLTLANGGTEEIVVKGETPVINK